jgi:GxxExxY protein
MEPGELKYPKPDEKIESILKQVLGAAIEVHKGLGPYQREEHYENAICHELDLRGIRYERQKPIKLVYKGKVVGEGRIDLLVQGRLVVELKAVENLNDVFMVQTKFYIRNVGEILGVILNFNVGAMNNKNAIRRVILGQQ